MLSAYEAGIFRACAFGPDQGKWGRPPSLCSWRLPGWFPHLGPLGSFRLHSRHRLLAASGSCELVRALLRGGSGRPHPADGPAPGHRGDPAHGTLCDQMGSGRSVQTGGTMPSCPRPWPSVPAGPPPGRASSSWQPPGPSRPRPPPGNRLTSCSAPCGLSPDLQWKGALGASTKGRDVHQ